MTITAVTILESGSIAELNTQIATAIGAGKQPFGKPFVHHLNQNETRVCIAMITGAQILVGDTGAPGTDGAAGAAGTVVTFGSAAPSGGANGDVYIKADGGIYKKVAGSWVLQVSFTPA